METRPLRRSATASRLLLGKAAVRVTPGGGDGEAANSGEASVSKWEAQAAAAATVAAAAAAPAAMGAAHGRPHFPGKKSPFTSKMGKTTKVVVYGLKGVGKTAILEQLIYGNINKSSELYSTIEDIYVANIETDRGTKEKVRFYDTAGLENPHSASPTARDQSQAAKQYMGLVDGYILVYDTDRPESLDVLMSLKKEIDKIRDKKEVIIIVLGNRTKPMDVGCLENTASKASHWAMREKVKHYEVNAMDRNSLYEPFIHLASRLNPPPNKSTFPQLSMVRKTIGRPEST